MALRWKTEIENALAMTKVAILLVSADFLASDFVHQEELPKILNASENEGLPILWIYLSHCLYKRTLIAKYQAAHDPVRSLAGLSQHEQDEVLLRVCEQVEMMLDEPPPLISVSKPQTISESLAIITPPTMDSLSIRLPEMAHIKERRIHCRRTLGNQCRPRWDRSFARSICKANGRIQTNFARMGARP